jgi:hypothetical protein
MKREDYDHTSCKIRSFLTTTSRSVPKLSVCVFGPPLSLRLVGHEAVLGCRALNHRLSDEKGRQISSACGTLFGGVSCSTLSRRGPNRNFPYYSDKFVLLGNG